MLKFGWAEIKISPWHPTYISSNINIKA